MVHEMCCSLRPQSVRPPTHPPQTEKKTASAAQTSATASAAQGRATDVIQETQSFPEHSAAVEEHEAANDTELVNIASKYGINVPENHVLNDGHWLENDPDVTFEYEHAQEVTVETSNATPPEQNEEITVPDGHGEDFVLARRRKAQEILLKTDMSQYVVQMVDPDSGEQLYHAETPPEPQSDDFSKKTVDSWDAETLEKRIAGYRILMDKVAKQFFTAHDEAVRLQRRYTRMACMHKKMAYTLRARHTLNIVGPMTEELEKKYKEFNTKKLRSRALEMKLEPSQGELDDQEFYERSREMLQDIPVKNKMDMQNDKLVVLHMFKFKCEVCGQTYRTKDGLNSHLRRHTGEGYKCDLCSEYRFFSSDKSFRRHLKFHRNGEQYKICDYPGCGKKFEEMPQLKSHSKVHKEPDLPCRAHNNCDKKFKQNSERVKHELYFDSSDTYECPDCGNMFNSPFNLKAHVKRIHFYNLPIVPGAQCPPDSRRCS